MKTLSKEVTSQFFNDENGYEELTKRWSEIINSDQKEQLTVGHYVLYAMLKGKDWTKAVPLPTNGNKLENGAWGYSGALRALRFVHYNTLFWPFDGIVSTAAIVKLRELIPQAHCYDHSGLEFRVGNPYPGVKESANV